MRLEQLKTISDIATSWLSVVALAVGGGFAGYQYLEKEKDDRLRTTLERLEQYNKAPIFDVRARVEAAWQRSGSEYDAVLDAKPFQASRLDELVMRVVADQQLAFDVSLLLSFFESLETCVQRQICDSASAVLFLQADARALYNLHYPFIQSERRRRNDPTFAGAVEAFAKRSAPQ